MHLAEDKPDTNSSFGEDLPPVPVQYKVIKSYYCILTVDFAPSSIGTSGALRGQGCLRVAANSSHEALPGP